MDSNERLCASTSRKSGMEKLSPPLVLPGNDELKYSSRSASRYGNGRRKIVSTALKIDVFAPMQSAKVRRAITVKPGFFINIRAPMRRSWKIARIFLRQSTQLFWDQMRRGVAPLLNLHRYGALSCYRAVKIVLRVHENKGR